MNADDRQVGGGHYKNLGYEHWNFVADASLGYFEGQITKYLSRHRKKNGLQDVQKAGHFAAKLLELAQVSNAPSTGPHRSVAVKLSAALKFIRANELEGTPESFAIRHFTLWTTRDDLITAFSYLQEVEDGYGSAEARSHGYVNQDGRVT